MCEDKDKGAVLADALELVHNRLAAVLSGLLRAVSECLLLRTVQN